MIIHLSNLFKNRNDPIVIDSYELYIRSITIEACRMTRLHSGKLIEAEANILNARPAIYANRSQYVYLWCDMRSEHHDH